MRKTESHVLQSKHSGADSCLVAVHITAPYKAQLETHPRTERQCSRSDLGQSEAQSERRGCSENVMPFSRQPLVIRLLYPPAQCTEGILLLLLPSLIISSCRPSCKQRRSYSVSNDLGWVCKRGSVSSFSTVFLNGKVMGKEEIGHWGLERAFVLPGYEELSIGERVKVKSEGEFSLRVSITAQPPLPAFRPSVMLSLAITATSVISHQSFSDVYVRYLQEGGPGMNSTSQILCWFVFSYSV